MHIYRHFEDLPPHARGAAVAIGNFDGVHCGHQTVIAEAGRIARDAGVPWAVLTFEPHPRSLFQPAGEPFRLTPLRIKTRHVEEMGADVLIVLHFDPAFASLSAEEFVRRVIVGGLAARHVVCGYDFLFGQGRSGNCRLLLSMGGEDGYGFTCMQAVTDETGRPYSSTRVRDALKVADPRAAARILGWNFEIEGRVEHGDSRGQRIGFPTANLHLQDYVRPATGVYAVRAGIDRGRDTAWRDGVANFGNRPTFDGGEAVLETHLFDFDGDLYGRHLRVQLVDYIRPERKFSGIEALKAQIAEDITTARRLLASP